MPISQNALTINSPSNPGADHGPREERDPRHGARERRRAAPTLRLANLQTQSPGASAARRGGPISSLGWTLPNTGTCVFFTRRALGGLCAGPHRDLGESWSEGARRRLVGLEWGGPQHCLLVLLRAQGRLEGANSLKRRFRKTVRLFLLGASGKASHYETAEEAGKAAAGLTPVPGAYRSSEAEGGFTHNSWLIRGPAVNSRTEKEAAIVGSSALRAPAVRVLTSREGATAAG
ncbi:hypothetical protein VUR80DRAFT_8323 [Thermomyces stellatus]